jgi:hypothetical protein
VLAAEQADAPGSNRRARPLRRDNAAVGLRLPLIDRRGHDGAVAAIGVIQQRAPDGGAASFMRRRSFELTIASVEASAFRRRLLFGDKGRVADAAHGRVLSHQAVGKYEKSEIRFPA